jgi:hypothetical protein
MQEPDLILISRRDIYNLYRTGVTFVFPWHLGDKPVNQLLIITPVNIFDDGQIVTISPTNQLIFRR